MENTLLATKKNTREHLMSLAQSAATRLPVSLSEWPKFTPHKLVRAHLNIDESFLTKIPDRKTPVIGA
jgi:hypothetical protein